jgi:hypothetical protein
VPRAPPPKPKQHKKIFVTVSACERLVTNVFGAHDEAARRVIEQRADAVLRRMVAEEQRLPEAYGEEEVK